MIRTYAPGSAPIGSGMSLHQSSLSVSLSTGSLPALAVGTLACLVFVTGCLPLPQIPQETIGALPGAARDRTSQPAPRFDDLDRPHRRTSSDTVSFEPVTFDQELAADPRGTSEARWDRIAEETIPRPSLEDRLTIQRRGNPRPGSAHPASRTDQNLPTVEFTPRRPSDTPRDETPHEDRRERLLFELQSYVDRPETALGDGERLAKHRLQMRLMALHFIEPTDPAGLELLIESMKAPHEPGRSHSLLRASFYESIDLERKSAEVLAQLSRELAVGSEPVSTLRIDPPIICSRIEGLGRYRALGNNEFRPGAELRLYVEVFGIENREVAEKYRQRLAIEFVLKDRDGRERGRQTSRTEGPPTDEPVIDSFLNLRYSIPREIPFGVATLEIAVRDQNSGGVSRQTVDLQIEP